MNKENIITASDEDLAQMLHEIRCCKNDKTGDYVILHIEEASEIITEACKRLTLKNSNPFKDNMRAYLAGIFLHSILERGYHAGPVAINTAIKNADEMLRQLDKTKSGETPRPVGSHD